MNDDQSTIETVRAFGRGAQRISNAEIMAIVAEKMPHTDRHYQKEVVGRFHALPSGFIATYSRVVADAVILRCVELGTNRSETA